MAGKNASDFEKIIHAHRERKQKEALAARIFNRNRRSSAPVKAFGQPPTSSLAGRAGINKHRVSSGPVRGGDLQGSNLTGLRKTTVSGSLASRVTTVGSGDGARETLKRQRNQQRHGGKLAFGLTKDQQHPAATRQVRVSDFTADTTPNSGRGISIRGLAGPPVVMAQNFAPGTTAADIESAFTPYGGLVTRCRLLKTNPLVIAEIVFEDPNGAQRVIDRFNNQVADGRVLKVYYRASLASGTAPASGDRNVVDGSHGFPGAEDVTDVEYGENSLYSDSLLARNSNNNSTVGTSVARSSCVNGTSTRLATNHADVRRGWKGPSP